MLNHQSSLTSINSNYKKNEELLKDPEFLKKDFNEPFEVLETKLVWYIDDAFVNILKKSINQKEIINDLVGLYLRKEGILQKFEKIEILLISEFLFIHFKFCLTIFENENKKIKILMNLFWILLRNRNKSYSDNNYDYILFNDNSTKNLKKDLKNDIIIFKKFLLKHSKFNKNHNYFDVKEILNIIEFIYYNYCQKFSLYKYVFENKKQNEEINLYVNIQRASAGKDLKYALGLGVEKNEIEQEEFKKLITKKITQNSEKILTNIESKNNSIKEIDNKDNSLINTKEFINNFTLNSKLNFENKLKNFN